MHRFFPYFFRYAFPLKFWWFICYGLFSYSCILCLLSHHFYGLFYCLIFRDISLKSQESLALFFRHISMDLFCLIFSVELSLLVIFLFCWFMHLFSRHVSFNIQWKFICLTFRWAIQFVFVYFIRIHSDIVSYLFIRILIEFAPYFSFELFS